MPRYPQSNLAACMLPWTARWELDKDQFARHVTDAIEGNYQSLYILGTAGEGYALSESRFQSVVKEFAALAVRDGLDPQVGVIGLSLEQLVARIEFAREHGFRMFQISLPSWGTLDEYETEIFFESICGRFEDCRFLHYNLPRAGRIIRGAEYHKLAAASPNLVATKNSTTDYARTADLMHYAPELQHFLLEGNFAMGCTLGECSLLCSLDVLFPKLTWEFFQAGLDKHVPELFRLTDLFHQAIIRLFAHCKRSMIDGSYDKVFVWLRNPGFPTRLLPPYLGLSDEELDTCRRVFESEFADLQ